MAVWAVLFFYTNEWPMWYHLWISYLLQRVKYLHSFWLKSYKVHPIYDVVLLVHYNLRCPVSLMFHRVLARIVVHFMNKNFCKIEWTQTKAWELYNVGSIDGQVHAVRLQTVNFRLFLHRTNDTPLLFAPWANRLRKITWVSVGFGSIYTLICILDMYIFYI